MLCSPMIQILGSGVLCCVIRQFCILFVSPQVLNADLSIHLQYIADIWNVSVRLSEEQHYEC